MPSEHHIFVIWSHPTFDISRVIADIRSEFGVLKVYEIEWSPEHLVNNLTSFYGFDHSRNFGVQEWRGGQNPTLILVCDDRPDYSERCGPRGEPQNSRTFAMKDKWRQLDMAPFRLQIHASDFPEEARAHFALLRHKSIACALAEDDMDGEETMRLRQDIAGVGGWPDIETLFHVLNETVKYCLIRDCDEEPYAYDSRTSYNADYEILVDYMERFASVITGGKVAHNAAFRFDYDDILVGSKVHKFHGKFVGDDYFDEKWQRKMLATRRLNKNGVYVIGDDESYFYSLLYHGLIHKDNWHKYDPILSRIAEEKRIPYKKDLSTVRNLLCSYMRTRGYKYFESIDCHWRPFHVENVPDRSMIDKGKTFVYYLIHPDAEGRGLPVLFNKKLVRYNRDLAYAMVTMDNNLSVRFADHIIDINDARFRALRRLIRGNTLALFLKFRLNCYLSCTEFCLEKGADCDLAAFVTARNIYVSKRLLWKKKQLLETNIRFFCEKNRIFIAGITYAQHLMNAAGDRAELIRRFDVFIGEMLARFALTSSDLLDEQAWDALPHNCIWTGDILWFDKDLRFYSPITRSYFLFRVIYYNDLPLAERMELYDYFSRRYFWPNQWTISDTMKINGFTS